MFDDEDRLVLFLGEFADQPRCGHALADVQIRRHLVEEVEVRVPGERGRDGDSLEFPTREVVDRLLHDGPEREPLDEFIESPALVGPLE